MFTFSLKIDDEEKSLTVQNGIPFERIAELLEKLFQAIDPHTDTKCTLSSIQGNSYCLKFNTDDQKYHDNFEVVHRNIEQVQMDELEPSQKEYAKCLKKVLGTRYYLTAYDNAEKPIASIKEVGIKTVIDYYFSTETVYGILSELGGISVNANKKHIYVDGVSYRIYISGTQDLELKPYYGTHKLMVKVRHKRSASDGHIISAEMISFTVIAEMDIVDNLKEVGYIDFALIKDANSMDEIVKRIYGDAD